MGGAGAALALSTPGGSAHIHADSDYCGLVSCAALHSARHSGARHSGARPRAVALGAPAGTQRSGPTPPPTPAKPEPPASSPAPARAKQPAGRGPRPTAGRTPSPSPAPSGPAVTVSYSTLRSWGVGFQGQFVITNHGSSAVTGWQMVITLSGDQVDTVWNADWQYGRGGSVILTAAPYDQAIEPGASQSVNIVAQGGTAGPTSCTFNGSACS
jgi:hypothetical protein